MKHVRSHIALLCVLLMTATMPSAYAQQLTFQDDTHRLDLGQQHWYSRFTKRYEPRLVPPINMSNSNRLDQLLRAGNLYLSLADAIALALENNIDIEVQRYNFLLTDTALYKANAGGLGVPNYDPVLTSTMQWGHTTQINSNTTLTAGSTSVVTTAKTANYGISQGFKSGGTATLTFNNNLGHQNSSGPAINPSTNSFLDLQVNQPLLNGFGFAMNTRNIRIAKNNLRFTDFQFEQQVINTVNAVAQAYWNLVSATLDVEAKKVALGQSQKLSEDNQKQVDIGTLAPITIVQADAEVAGRELDLITSQSNVLTGEATLKNLLSRNGLASPALLSAHVVATDRITLPAVEPVEPIQDLVQKALDKRPDLAQTRVQLDNSKITMTGTRNAMLPSLNAFTDLRNSGLSGFNNDIKPSDPRFAPQPGNPYFVGGYGNVLSQLFGRNFPTYTVGVNLTIPLGNRASQADYATAQLQLRQSELNIQKTVNQIRVDVQNALTNVQQARARYQSATKARVLQEQTLDAEQKKNALGASTVYQVIVVQRDLANARQNEVAALTTYALAKLQMDVATGMLLDRNNVQIEEARQGRVSRPPDPIREVIPQGATNVAPGTPAIAAR